LVLGIALSLPFVQTQLAQCFTKTINKDFGTNISIDEVSVTVFGGVKLKKVLILDHHKDTLIYANRIKTNILDFKKLVDGDMIFNSIGLDGVYFNLKTYKNEKDTNIDKFIDAFGKPKPSGKHTLLTAKNAIITNSHFILIDENQNLSKEVDFTKLNASISDFKLYGPNVNTTIDKMSFLDHRGIFVVNLSSKFSYTKKRIQLENIDLLTKDSKLKGRLYLNYKIEDFRDFNNKVQFDSKITYSSIGTNDIRCFYNEIGKNQHLKIKAIIKGTLNDLKLSNLLLTNFKKSQIIGSINFKNLFPKKEQRFYMNGKFFKLSSTYDDLVSLLPNVLGKRLPIDLKKLGEFAIVGDTQLTQSEIAANFSMKSALGNLKTNLSMENIDFIDNASYKGNVVLDKFDIGTFLERKDIGKVSLNIDFDGVGFLEKYLNTSINGDITEVDYNNYLYSNVTVNGIFKSRLYKGQFSVNDPNLNMTFDGLVDMSQKESKYDFHVNVENSNLSKLKIVNQPISKFKGDVVVQVSGNSIEDLYGDVIIKKTAYQNVKNTYYFDDFTINSTFDKYRLRNITFHSPDIVEGDITGKFQFKQLNNLIVNSLGSLYTNYKPLIVSKGQFLKFNFTIYNKIIEIVYPEIAIGSNTIVKGNINSDNKEFKLNFNSPQIVAYQNTFDNIRLKIDNKNPLYNAYIELDTIKNKHYTIRDFSLINVTKKDTLFFRSEFKGGSKGEDYFNLNLYHTINNDNNNIIGISKSEIKLKNYLWYLNEKGGSDNKIVFDKSLHNFNFDNLLMSHENQKISLNGDLNGSSYRNLKLILKNVDLNGITPADPKFTFNGNINAEVNYKRDKEIYQMPASIKIDHLNINKTDLGDLNLDVNGDESFRNFTINSSLENNNLESLHTTGSFEMLNDKIALDLNLKLDKFNLGILSSLGGDVLSNIRGYASGNASIGGNFNKPEINGRLYIDNAGITIPYLNVDYNIEDKSIVDLTDDKFLIRNSVLTDSKFGTKGILNGSIEHKVFSDWKLDLAIDSKRLLVLDTKDHEDAAYYGVAYINGNAIIKGPTNALLIKVDAKSEKGSAIKIPIDDSENISENDFIHFLSKKEKYNIKKGIVDNSKKYKGLELEFDLDITPNAEVEVILDRNSGHGMKGKGNGTLLFKINTLGKFNMWGDFQAYEGTYNFNYGGIIKKEFKVKKGGYISWEGDPLKARLNLEAVYKTSANPAVLLDNSSLNKKVDVNLVIGVRGDLKSPEPDFSFEFPNVSSVLKSEIDYKLNDKDIRQTQAMYLLSTGGFLSSEGVNQSAISGNAFETAKGLLSGIIRSEDKKFKVDIDIISADKTIGRETDGRFVASISSKVNERVTINGKVGVPFGGISQTAVIGNLEILYRVNNDGTLNLRFFNKENDINYIGEGIGYTQGFGVSYEVDFDTFQELANKIFKNKKIEKNEKIAIPNSTIQDSSFLLETNNSSKSKKPKPNDSKHNQEGVIPEED
jgi:hypothetical protein